MTPTSTAPITSLSQLDPACRYTYADYLTWKFDEFVKLVKGRVLGPMPVSTLPGLALPWEEIFAAD